MGQCLPLVRKNPLISWHQEPVQFSLSMYVDEKTQGTVFCLLREDPRSAAL